MTLNKTDIFIIAACEVTAGALEAIVIPNLGKGKGEKFVMPDKKAILVSGIALSASGVAAGYTANALLDTYNITADQKLKRTLVIAGTVFMFNAMEALLVGNITTHMADISKYEIPPFRKFAAQMSFLALTGLASGFVSNQFISTTAITAPALAASAASTQKPLSQILVDQTPEDIALLNAQAAQAATTATTTPQI